MLSRKAWLVLIVFSLLLATRATAQAIRLTPATPTVEVDEETFLEVELVTTSANPVFAAEVTFAIPQGMEVLTRANGAPDVLVDSRWLTNVTKVDSSTVNIAVTAGDDKLPCTETCSIATVGVVFRSSGPVDVVITRQRSGLLKDDAALTELRVRDFFDAQLQVGGGPGGCAGGSECGDLNGDGQISSQEIRDIVRAFLLDSVSDAICTHLALPSGCELTSQKLRDIIRNFLIQDK
jgi:hypothetical protein